MLRLLCIADCMTDNNPNSSASIPASDLATLEHLGIPAELVARAYIERVTDREARKKYGIRGAEDPAALG